MVTQKKAKDWQRETDTESCDSFTSGDFAVSISQPYVYICVTVWPCTPICATQSQSMTSTTTIAPTFTRFWTTAAIVWLSNCGMTFSLQVKNTREYYHPLPTLLLALIFSQQDPHYLPWWLLLFSRTFLSLRAHESSQALLYGSDTGTAH